MTGFQPKIGWKHPDRLELLYDEPDLCDLDTFDDSQRGLLSRRWGSLGDGI